MSLPNAEGPIKSAQEARDAIASLENILDRLEQTLAEETEHVRAGRLRDAAVLTTAKVDLLRLYAAESDRVKAASQAIAGWLPERIKHLRQRHDVFHDVLRTNLTVLATAHAVSEGIIRGVSGELARKHVPSTYGPSGRTQSPARKAALPLALSRSL